MRIPFYSLLLFLPALFIGLTDPASGQQTNEVRAPLELEPRTYKMISVPVDLRDKDFMSVLEDDYGPYNVNEWRLFRYNSTTTDYDEFPGIDGDFTRGTAVWLITQSGRPFDIDVILGSQQCSVGARVPLMVYPGWNQVGTPFPCTIPCGPLLNGIANLVPDIEHVEQPVYYNGIEYEYGVSQCVPWEGYFIFVRAQRPVLVDLVLPSFSDALSKGTASANADADYLVQLAATMENGSLTDTQNYVGLLPDADIGLDEYDYMEAPPIGRYVQLSVVEDGYRFAGNFKPETVQGHRWDFELRATQANATADISLQERGRRPDGFDLYVLDRDANTVLPLHGQTFRVQLGAKNLTRHFTLLLGTEAYAEAYTADLQESPTTYALSQNYPNPFNPETQISYQLGQRSAVVLDVFDVLGRRVRRLVHETQDAGRHTVQWDGRTDVGRAAASGIYLYMISAGDFADTRQMLLMR